MLYLKLLLFGFGFLHRPHSKAPDALHAEVGGGSQNGALTNSHVLQQ